MQPRAHRIDVELTRSGSVVAFFALSAGGWRRDRRDGLWRDPSWRAIRVGRRHRRVPFPADWPARDTPPGRHRRAE